MAFTKVVGAGIHTLSNITSHNINSSGIITATKFIGPFDGGGGINAGIVTCTTLDLNGNGDVSGNFVIDGNLTVNGTTSTIDTNLIGVDRVEVGANSNSIVGVAITQSGTADILNLFDGATKVVTIDDVGNVGLASAIPSKKLDVVGDTLIQGQTTISHTGAPQLIIKDSDTTGAADSNGISFRDASNTQYGFIGQTSSAGHTMLINTTNTVNPIRLQVNSSTKLEIGHTGVYVDNANFFVNGSYNAYLSGEVHMADSLIHQGDTDTKIRFPAANTVSVETAGSERFRIDSSGTAEFHGGDQGTDHIKVDSEAGGGAIFISNFRGVTDTGDTTRLGVGKNNNALIFMNASGSQVDNFVIGNTDAVPLIFSTANTQRIHIGSTGKVGIGTNNASSFHGSHNDLVIGEGAGSAGLTIHSGSSNLGALVFNDAANNSIPAQVGYSHAATELYFRTESTYKFEVGTTEVLNISGTGKVVKQLFTATNTYAANNTTQCGYQAQNLSDTTNTYAALRLTAGSSGPATAQLSSIRTGSGQNDFTIQLESGNTAFEALRIKSGGDLYLNSSTALTSPNTGYRHISISNNAIFFAESSAGGFTGFTNNAYVNSSGNWVRVNNDHASVIGMDDGVLTYRKAGAGTGNITWEEGFRVDSQGNFTTTQQATYSRTNAGFTARRGDSVQVTRAAGTPLEICRTTSEGAIIGFFNDSTNIGGFKVDVHDLTYNTYQAGDAEIIRFDGNNLKVTTASDLEIGGVYKGPQDYPNVKPIFDFNFAKVKKLDSRFRCFRTGGASYVDEFGYIKIASYNAPRFDHDPITRECKGLLIEPSRENKISYSHSYSPDTGGAVENYTEETRSPDGEYNAKKITGGAGGGSYNEGTSTTGVFSVFLKAGSTNYVQIQGGGVGMNNSTVGPYTKNTVINLSNGTFTVNEQGFTAKQYRDGWWRVSVVYTTGSTYQGTTWSIRCLDSSSPSADNVDNEEHCYAWGQVYEVGSFITSYIPSGPSSQNTRGNENIRIGNTEKYNEFTDMFNAEEGTIITEHEILSNQTNQVIVGFHKDFSDVDRIEVRATGSNSARARFEVVNTSSSVVYMMDSSLAHSGIGINKNNKYAFAFKGNDYAGVVNGGSAQTDTSGNVPTGLNGMIVGNSVYTVRSHLYIKRLTLYSQRLSNNQMQNLTS